MTTRELKLWTVFFEDTYRKPFELRAYTGRECMHEVVYVLPEGSPGLADGFVGFGLGPWAGVPR